MGVKQTAATTMAENEKLNQSFNWVETFPNAEHTHTHTPSDCHKYLIDLSILLDEFYGNFSPFASRFYQNQHHHQQHQQRTPRATVSIIEMAANQNESEISGFFLPILRWILRPIFVMFPLFRCSARSSRFLLSMCSAFFLDTCLLDSSPAYVHHCGYIFIKR